MDIEFKAMDRVLITTPTLCHFHYTVTAELMRLQSANSHRYRIGWIPLIGRPGEWLCNQAVDYVRQPVVSADGHEQWWDWWLHMDCDNPPRRDPLELIDLDLPLVILPTPMVNPHRDENVRITKWNVWDCEHRKGLTKIRWGGAGCFLAKGDAVRQCATPMFDWRYQDQTTKKEMAASPDSLFCKRFTDAGFPIHAHWDYPCNHWRDNLNLYRVALAEDELEQWRAGLRTVSSGSASSEVVSCSGPGSPGTFWD